MSAGTIADLSTTAPLSALLAGLTSIPTSTSTAAVVLPLVGDMPAWVVVIGATSVLPSGMTINFAASYNGGASWHTTNGTLHGASPTLEANSTTSANNLASEANTQVWQGLAAGATHLAVWCSAFTSGSVSVTLTASAAQRHVVVQGSVSIGLESIEIGKVDQGAHGTDPWEVDTNAVRSAGVAPHRSAITAVDKLSTPSAPTVTDSSASGSLVQSTAYFVAVAAGNRYGTTTAAISASHTTGSGKTAVQFTQAQVTGPGTTVAEWYDIFSLGTSPPLWVARVTEAQRANANGVIITAVGTAVAGSSLGAGVIQVNLVGTGVASNATNFAQNNAYVPQGITPVNCAGKSILHFLLETSLADLRSAPSLSLIPFFLGQQSGNFYQGALTVVPLLSALGQCLFVDYPVELDGATGACLLVDAIGGQGTSVTIYPEQA